MPAPKEQFRAPLADALALAYPGGPGKEAKVSLSTRTASAKLEGAVVTAAGIHAPAKVEFRAGESVRLGWVASPLGRRRRCGSGCATAKVPGAPPPS
jgi:hypothetical protein